ncbi:hypothetical protein LTR08_002303 [Meristemomyces frigidus]|nr:hypothetical protein LTR08_002303 [Meristemomyces frigidus]
MDMGVRPAMATLLPPPSSMPGSQQWHAQRPQSQPPPARREQRARKERSANQVRAKPADLGVINSILDSFETLTSSPTLYAHERYSGTGPGGSKRSRPHSADGTFSPAPTVARSAGFGVEYGTGPSLDDETGTSDAALPPNIRTSRSRSGLSSFTAHSPSLGSDSGNGYLRPSSHDSRTSSCSSGMKEKDRGVRSKHSAESWIKQTPNSPDQESVYTDRSKKNHTNLSRIASQEALRPVKVAEPPARPQLAEVRTVSRAEEIIAKTPPPKDRLFLEDTPVSEEHAIVDSPISVSRVPGSTGCPCSSVQTTATDQSPFTLALPKRMSPSKSPIGDSIPTRTSSLRHTNDITKSGKKRDRKSKRQTFASSNSDTVVPQQSPNILESSWMDLGEDDDTVKRIRQLQGQRQSRIEESKAFSFVTENDPATVSVANHNPVSKPSAGSEEHRRASRVRPLPNRAATEPASKAHKLLGLIDNVTTSDWNGVAIGSTYVDVVDSPARKRPQSRSDDRATHFVQTRPGTASSYSPPITLDYSYAQVIDALHGIGQDTQQGQPSGRRLSVASLTVEALDLPLPSAPVSPLTQATGSASPESVRRRDSQERWTAHHPDLLLDFDKRKSRRKSMSDARRTRHIEEDVNLQRRDSVEDAVMEHLYAPRLTQKVRHPLTGRLISFSEVGDPEGAAVFICVGMGLTRYVTAFYDELATTLRLRLITVDRPGVGGSEPFPPTDRSGPLSWPDDVLAISQQLGIAKFSLLAHSAGAIYALATALTLPHLIKGKVHLLAPWIPPSQLEAISHPTASAPPAGALPRSQRILRVLPTSFLRAANSSFMTATSTSLKPASKRQIDAAKLRQREQSLSPSRASERPITAARPDYHKRESMMRMDQLMPTVNPMENFPTPVREEEEECKGEQCRGSLYLSATATPNDPNFTFASAALNAAEHAEKERKLEYTSRLTQRTWELATRDSNPATDLLVCLERHREIGFRYTDVGREVVITHGSEDKRVPLGNVKWLAEQVNARALVGLTADIAGNSLPHSREGWAEPGYSRGGCEVRVIEGEGHGLMASAPLMSDVLTEIAGYWTRQDKGRVAL